LALARLRAALAATEIAGPRTNVVFLQRIASCAPFSQAVLDTGLIERNRETLFPAPAGTPREMLAGAAYAELALEQEAAHAQALASGDPHSPWHLVDGWRLNEDSHHDFVFLEGDIAHAARVRFLAAEMRIEIDGEDHSFGGEQLDDGRLLVRLDGNAFKLRAVREGNVWHLFSPGEYRRFALRDELQGLDEDAESGSLAAPMPGKVIAVMAKSGAHVAKGTPLLVLEAMKMEHTISAPANGLVKDVRCAPGDQVLEGFELIAFEADAA
jgi:3-methylcrotonyl-CoA carboxylase alpha subunit